MPIPHFGGYFETIPTRFFPRSGLITTDLVGDFWQTSAIFEPSTAQKPRQNCRLGIVSFLAEWADFFGLWLGVDHTDLWGSSESRGHDQLNDGRIASRTGGQLVSLDVPLPHNGQLAISVVYRAPVGADLLIHEKILKPTMKKSPYIPLLERGTKGGFCPTAPLTDMFNFLFK